MKKRSLLTERQAWAVIAEMFSEFRIVKPYPDSDVMVSRFTLSGICNAIAILEDLGLITRSLARNLELTIERLPKGEAGFAWPRTEAGMKARVRYARRQARRSR